MLELNIYDFPYNEIQSVRFQFFIKARRRRNTYTIQAESQPRPFFNSQTEGMIIMKKQLFTKFLSAFLSAALLVTMLPGGILKVSAASTLSITQTGGTGGFTQDVDGNIVITENGSYTILGDSTSAGVSVASGVTADVTMSNVDIDVSGANGKSAFSIASGASVNLTLSGANTLKSGQYRAGIQVPSGASVSITGTGSDSLTVNGGCEGAGIGGSKCNGGAITISGGIVIATGGQYGTGIGGGDYGAGCKLMIAGGTVTATGGQGCDGIGGAGTGDSNGTTVITGGSVYASSVPGGVTDGSGNAEYCVTASTTFGANAAVTGSVNVGPTSDMQTDSKGNLYFWMPSTGVAMVEYNSAYYCTHVSGITGNITASLSAMQTLDISTGSIVLADGKITQGSNTYSVNGCVITQSASGSTSNIVSVTGGTHCVVLKDVDIEYSSGCAFGLSGSSTVAIALCGDNTLTSGSGFAGIQVPTGSSIAVTGSDSDSLTVTGGNGSDGVAGIGSGGGEHDYCGSITVNGGKVTATGGNSPNKNMFGDGIDGGAGIGGGMGADGGNITINGGAVVAVGKNSAAGIGGGYGSSGGTVTINGGSVKANGSTYAAGIGGSNTGSGGTVTINAGSVNAGGSGHGEGIGGGYQGSGGTVNVTGGTVTANGENGGAGIGGGYSGSGGTVTITGGTTTAAGDNGSAGIGGGCDSGSGIVTISGGSVTAIGNKGGAGIGAGSTGNGGTVNISGGLITADGGSVGAGIGGGYDGGSGIVTISGGIVHATGGNGIVNYGGGAGIGGGSHSAFTSGSSDTVKISGGTVTANGGSSSTDIGAGSSGNCGAVIITGGTVIANKITRPTNGSVSVYKTTLALPAGNGVQSLSVKQSGTAYSYGSKDMQTDASSYGKLYFWLPANNTTADVTTGSGIYSGYHGTVDSSNVSVLKMDQNLTIGGVAAAGSYTYGSVPAVTVSGGAPDIAAAISFSGHDNTKNSDLPANDTMPPADAGTYTVTATKTGNSAYNPGTATMSFTISQKLLTSSDISVSNTSTQEYDGSAHTPAVSVRDGSTDLVKDTDYSVTDKTTGTLNPAYTAVGSYNLETTGKGNYSGTVEKAFIIEAAPTITVDGDSGNWHTSIPLTITATAGSSGIKNVTVYENNHPTDKADITGTYNSGKYSYTASENGTYTFTVTSNSDFTASQSVTVNRIDSGAPSLSSVSGNPISPAQSAELSVTATPGPSGIGSVTVSRYDGDQWARISGAQINDTVNQNGSLTYTYTATQNGTYKLTVTSTTGVAADSNSVDVTEIDTAKPIVQINSNGYTGGTWTKSSVTLNVSDSTANLGTASFEYSTDSGKTWSSFNGSLTDSAEGSATYSFRATSASGVAGDIQSITVKIDKTAPETHKITISNNNFTSFLNTVTFGLFFKDTQISPRSTRLSRFRAYSSIVSQSKFVFSLCAWNFMMGMNVSR